LYCKLCGEHLYKKITFQNLFKFNYFVHEECEKKLNKNIEYNTFPLMDKLVFHDYLFDEFCKDSDLDFLYRMYAENFYERMLKNKEWSIVVFIEAKLDVNTVILVTKLAEKAILFCSVFNENFL